jgi:FkbM family methyltransferase
MAAQNGIDEIILKNFGTNGFFVEAGGSDPRDQNNTALLEMNGWKGLIIEPKKEFNNLYAQIRPNSIVENYVLVSKNYEEKTISGDFRHYMMGGVSNIHSFSDWQPSEYPCSTLHELLLKHNIEEVTFFSLDVEGYEKEVLEGVDFNSVFFHALVIETHLVNNNISNFDFLQDFGFDKKLTIKQHEFYLNRKSKQNQLFI